MNAIRRKLLATLVVVALGAVLIPAASAECANPTTKARISPQSWNGQTGVAPNFLLVSDRDHQVSMIGMWHVVFIAKGNVGPGLPPDGAPVDNTMSHWHSDGTELTVASRPPATGNVCLGVWEKVGERHYLLNHFGISFDPATDPNVPLGFANIRQDIVLNPDGRTFRGRFSIRQYDRSGNLLLEIKGLLKGTRVEIDTSVGDLVSQD